MFERTCELQSFARSSPRRTGSELRSSPPSLSFVQSTGLESGLVSLMSSSLETYLQILKRGLTPCVLGPVSKRGTARSCRISKRRIRDWCVLRQRKTVNARRSSSHRLPSKPHGPTTRVSLLVSLTQRVPWGVDENVTRCSLKSNMGWLVCGHAIFFLPDCYSDAVRFDELLRGCTGGKAGRRKG